MPDLKDDSSSFFLEVRQKKKKANLNDLKDNSAEAQGSLEEKTTNHLLSWLNPQDLNRTYGWHEPLRQKF